jgi:hypothetical protein
MEDRMKFESSVIRRTPTHWIARPTFESINWDLVRRTRAGELLGGRIESERVRRPTGIDNSRREDRRPRVFLKGAEAAIGSRLNPAPAQRSCT